MNLTDDEIRVKCAEAMGWKHCSMSGDKLTNPDAYWYPPENYTPPGWKEPCNMRHLSQLPRFESSADAALTLCDRLREEGWCLQITYGVTDKWTVTFYQGQGRFFTVQDPSLARAICLAFLKVKGEVK